MQFQRNYLSLLIFAFYKRVAYRGKLIFGKGDDGMFTGMLVICFVLPSQLSQVGEKSVSILSKVLHEPITIKAIPSEIEEAFTNWNSLCSKKFLPERRFDEMASNFFWLIIECGVQEGCFNSRKQAMVSAQNLVSEALSSEKMFALSRAFQAVVITLYYEEISKAFAKGEDAYPELRNEVASIDQEISQLFKCMGELEAKAKEIRVQSFWQKNADALPLAVALGVICVALLFGIRFRKTRD